MLTLPYDVDVAEDRRPFANWLIFCLLIAVFVFQVTDRTNPTGINVYKFFLVDWHISGLFGHMWLHGNFLHLMGNLLFLWIFGNAVCSKLGNFLYLILYISLGLVSAFACLIFGEVPAIGASGAISGAAGMFLVFFLFNKIKCVFVCFFPPLFKRFRVSIYWWIGFWVVYENILGIILWKQNVAYFGHLGGFFSGFFLAVIMVKLRLTVPDWYQQRLWDMLGLKQALEEIPQGPEEEVQKNRRVYDHAEIEEWVQQQQM